MHNIIKAVLFLTIGTSAVAQQSIMEIASSDQQENWWSFHNGQNITPDTFFQTYQESMGFDANYSFIELKREEDDLGINHIRYEQFYKGVKVEGAQFILHSRGNTLYKANGRLVKSLQGSPVATVSFKDALNTAKQLTEANSFYWEDPYMEAWLKDVKGNPNASFAPKEELVWLDPQFSQNGENYKLAYKLDLFFEATDDHRLFYIDANTGNLLWEQNRCHSATAHGQAETKYHGTQNIITDSVSTNKYVLNDVTRGGGVQTLNAQTGTSFQNSVDFEDDDNYWDNVNAQIDEAATDAHWSAGMTYDYFLSEHNRDSYDGLGSKIVSYVHWDQAWRNASWNGVAMRYGDGSGDPLISIDVVGHELAHGVTEYSANLVYAYEPGALNESFSDIFGTAIEFHALDSAADWDIGKASFLLRSMSNPKAYSQPDTYLGQAWYTGSGDNGGVHYNSGVQNFWFYLLSEGGSGTNDNGTAYQVDSFGIDNAAEIAYRNLAYYLTPSSEYYDSRRGSISAAEDIYGSCSYEANLIAKAWHAVGIGSDTLSNDIELLEVLSPKNSCSIGTQETMEVKFIYYRSGCDSTIEAGDSIQLGYSVNGSNAVSETLIAGSTINSGDTITYTFNTKQDFINVGAYNIKFWTNYSSDYMTENDTISDYIIKVLDPMVDGDSISFEASLAATEEKIYHTATESNGDTYLHFNGRSTGFRGLVLSGIDADLFNLDIPNDETENFDKNKEFLSKVYMCVDASAMSHVTLKFDLKQTYSTVYRFFLGTNANTLASSLRLTIDGVQVGTQMHPTSNFSDTFATHYFNLDQYAGTQFELALEGKHFLSRAEDPGNSVGDNSYIDDIIIMDSEFIGEEEFELKDVSLFPNPTTGLLNINVNAPKSGMATAKIVDTKGAVILQKSLDLESGFQSFSLDISGKPKGMYLLQIQQGNALYTQKVMLD
ncbi:Zinc metalloprotease (elastase) [Owenweeksia hongkongensis DSM 17368]|uniref:Zinc metalloprotease (Elastase) n=1 Tax=Owenweeksia hongkongensis (strain DSM 17368 / CIP 108786 / JCM 12287 / NRRL B-23963 / UST20020801) TaxID=926562 RepID=G8R350_OWEHD|nr:M4 family metallopeptidase [Owenweeksia hongkongensis]AEV34075.1 Zinc metalloprotease (elastase) [Owenweeksia hongkongensis DSM 17368]